MPDPVTTITAHQDLVAGQRLDQPTFHALYQRMPHGTRAELIDGVVHMPGPVGREHGEAQVPVIVWLSYYAENTPGIRAMDNATIILGWKSEPQPDGLLRLLPDFGGRTWDEGGFVHGAPELVAEIAKATRYVDLGPKRDDYERAGVQEYVVRAIDPDQILLQHRRTRRLFVSHCRGSAVMNPLPSGRARGYRAESRSECVCRSPHRSRPR
jgi:Putative restriction endonuclease